MVSGRRPVVVVMSGVSVVVVGVSLHASQLSPTTHRVAAAPVGVVSAGAGGAAGPVTTAARVAAARASSVAQAAATARASTAARAAAAREAAARTAAAQAAARTGSASPTAVPRRTTAPAARRTASAQPTAAPSVTVNGSAFDTRYGPVQVQITLRSGRIIRSDAIEYPQSSGRDQEINSYAIPQLDKETVDAQSAQIDTVSGASYTSDGYRQSLQSAIDAAHQAGAL